MSWRDTARRLAAEDCEAPESAGAAAPVDEIERGEREAIAVVDGGLPESWAAALWAIEHGPRPQAIGEKDWRVALDRVWSRAAEHGAEFVAHGWTFEEVFGVGENWLRLDERGAVWLATGARIVAIDPQRVTFERGDRRSTHTKPGVIH